MLLAVTRLNIPIFWISICQVCSVYIYIYIKKVLLQLEVLLHCNFLVRYLACLITVIIMQKLVDLSTLSKNQVIFLMFQTYYWQGANLKTYRTCEVALHSTCFCNLLKRLEQRKLTKDVAKLVIPDVWRCGETQILASHVHLSTDGVVLFLLRIVSRTFYNSRF